MKRIYLWLREMSLTQQLVSIVIVVIAVFAIFSSVFLTPSIASFTENEMLRSLHATHASTVYYLNNSPDVTPYSASDSETGIIQGIYSYRLNKFITFGDDTFSEEELSEFRLRIKEADSERDDYHLKENEDLSGSADKVLYCVTRLENGDVLFSLMPSRYEEQFRALLLNDVVNVNIIIVGLLFMMLLLWVASLIHPLNLIRNYVTKLKNEDPAVLNVNRRDEIGEVADALVEMQKELEKQNREKEEMIQNISHDLKTPIATIKSYGESIKDGIYPYGTLEKSIDVIIEHADRLEKKVRSLIALNKMEYLLDDCPSGDTLNMNDVIDKVLLSLKVIRPEISFERIMEPDVWFHGDEDPWRIVVENLIDNALRYAKTTISIRLSQNELIVRNDGSQIEASRLEKLFKPYEKGTDGQFGLGLSIVYKVVTTYGYKVEANNLSDGVQFRIWREVTKKEKKAKAKEAKKKEKADNA